MKNNPSFSNLKGPKNGFQLSDASLIMEILRDSFYADKIETPIKEILCNARDAMREAKNKKDRIEVSLPTLENPVLKIRDFGPGLSKKRVNEVFRFYGRSTKKAALGQTGHFGLGAKSPFAYSESFVVISYFNGEEIHYIAHLGESGKGGEIEVSFRAKTRKKNGVEVQIPVLKKEDLRRFLVSVYKNTAFWEQEEKPHILNVTEGLFAEAKVYRDLEKNTALSLPHLLVVRDLPRAFGTYNQLGLGVLVDGLYYSVPEHELFSHVFQRFNQLSGYNALKCAFILKLKVKSIDISPNREVITLTQKTLSAIEEAFEKAEGELFQFAKKEIEARDLNSLPEFFEKHMKFLNLEELYFAHHKKEGLKLKAYPHAPLTIQNKEFFSLQPKIFLSTLKFKKEPATLPFSDLVSFSLLNQEEIEERLRVYLEQKGLKSGHFTVIERTEKTAEFLNQYPAFDLNQIVLDGEDGRFLTYVMNSVEEKKEYSFKDLKAFRHVFLYSGVGADHSSMSVNGHFVKRSELARAANLLKDENIVFLRVPKLEHREKILKLKSVSVFQDFAQILNGPLKDVAERLKQNPVEDDGEELSFLDRAFFLALKQEKEQILDPRFLALFKKLEAQPKKTLPKFMALALQKEQKNESSSQDLLKELIESYPLLKLVKSQPLFRKELNELIHYMNFKFKALNPWWRFCSSHFWFRPRAMRRWGWRRGLEVYKSAH